MTAQGRFQKRFKQYTVVSTFRFSKTCARDWRELRRTRYRHRRRFVRPSRKEYERLHEFFCVVVFDIFYDLFVLIYNSIFLHGLCGGYQSIKGYGGRYRRRRCFRRGELEGQHDFASCFPCAPRMYRHIGFNVKICLKMTRRSVQMSFRRLSSVVFVKDFRKLELML